MHGQQWADDCSRTHLDAKGADLGAAVAQGLRRLAGGVHLNLRRQ